MVLGVVTKPFWCQKVCEISNTKSKYYVQIIIVADRPRDGSKDIYFHYTKVGYGGRNRMVRAVCYPQPASIESPDHQ
jgi:hypothetical protein